MTLAYPLQQPHPELAEVYRELLLRSDRVESLPLDYAMAEAAAGLRARYRLRTPDAVQIAAALSAGCEAFLTNDINLLCVAEIRVLVVDHLTA